MFTGNTEAVAQEKHKDNLRRFEEANLVKQFEQNNKRFNLWQIVRNWLRMVTQKQSTIVYAEPVLIEELTFAEEAA